MKFELYWTPTDALRRAHLIETGEQMDSKQFLEVELTELTPEQRTIILASKDRFSDSIANILPECTGVKMPYGIGSGNAEFETGGSVSFDHVPTLEGWLHNAAKMLATYDVHRPELDAANATLKAQRRRAQELTKEYRTLQEEWWKRIAKMTEEEANQPLPESVVELERETKAVGGTIYSTPITQDLVSRRHELRNERLKAEAYAAKEAWIEAHGSDQLRRGFERGHDCGRLYTLERAAIEAPGYVVDYYDGAKWKDRSCPSVAALNGAEAAELLNVGDVKIIWLTEPPVDTKIDNEYYDYSEPFEACEAVVISNYLGKYDLVKVV